MEAGQAAALHLRASAWYEQNGLLPEAVSHALLAGDIGRTARLVEDNALPMIHHGQLATLVRWLEALPAEVIRAWPWLSIARAWVLAYSGDLAAVEPVLLDAERALPDLPTLQTDRHRHNEREHIAGQIAAIRSYCALLAGDIPRGMYQAREALQCLPDDDLRGQAFTALLLGAMLFESGEIAAAIETATDATAMSQAAGDTLLTVLILSDLTTFYFRQGQLRKAEATCQHALDLCAEHTRKGGYESPAVGFIYGRLSTVRHEWNDLPAAVHYARQALEMGRRWGQKDAMLIAYSNLARTLAASGDAASALAAIREARQGAVSLALYGDAMRVSGSRPLAGPG